jgi:heme oxygenase
MKTNLKTIYLYREVIAVMNQHFSNLSATKKNIPKLNSLIKLLEEIEADLAGGGECIIELDKPRQEAIMEREAVINQINEFNNKADDL